MEKKGWQAFKQKKTSQRPCGQSATTTRADAGHCGATLSLASSSHLPTWQPANRPPAGWTLIRDHTQILMSMVTGERTSRRVGWPAARLR